MPPHNRRESYRANHFKQSVFTRPGPKAEQRNRGLHVGYWGYTRHGQNRRRHPSHGHAL